MLLTGNVPVPIPKQVEGYEIVELREGECNCYGCALESEPCPIRGLLCISSDSKHEWKYHEKTKN